MAGGDQGTGVDSWALTIKAEKSLSPPAFYLGIEALHDICNNASRELGFASLS